MSLNFFLPYREGKKILWFNVVASLLIFFGVFGFLCIIFSGMGWLSWLPSSFEWPVGYTSGIVTTDAGYFVVSHSPSGRIQIYDDKWQFINGWYVDAGGGNFSIGYTGGNQIDVITARGNKHYIFNFNGELLFEEISSDYDGLNINRNNVVQFVPTPPWLIPFTHPFLSLALVLIGNVIFKIGQKRYR